VGLVGESGCGKTTTGRLILRAIEATEGAILFRMGAGEVVDVATASREQLKRLRREMQIIFQVILAGDVPSPSDPPSGCKFHPRCQYAKDICKTEVPLWQEREPGHWTACHLADELSLSGV
jgi:oligopeptide/dipeptide ABC transporter ATP-binding protein